MYDTVAQYGQVLSGDVDDWHPPMMVRVWQQLLRLGGGAAPMFALQISLYALGCGLLVGALMRTGRPRASIAAGVVVLSPLLLGWQMVVLKDAQMEGALLAALGIAAHYRLAKRSVPPPAGLAMALLLGYATLVRANAIFVTAPLAVMLLPRPKAMAARALLTVFVVLVGLGITPLINHQLLGARASGVEKSQPVFDLAAIAVAAPRSPSIFTSSEIRQIATRHCVKAFFWDPLGEPTACASSTNRLMNSPAKDLYLALARAALRHPGAYIEHRLQHWNSTERWLVPASLPDAGPPIEAEPNDLGLGTPPSPFANAWQDLAAFEVGTPLGWPIFWAAVALCLLPCAWRQRDTSNGNFALAMLSSSLSLELSFLFISIASDLRYHLWLMTASPLALVLLSQELRFRVRQWLVTAAFVGLIVGAGVYTRWSLPRAPASYEGMIHAATG